MDAHEKDNCMPEQKVKAPQGGLNANFHGVINPYTQYQNTTLI